MQKKMINGFKDLHFILKKLWFEDETRKKKKKPSWLTPVSHGYHTINRLNHTENVDSILVQREEQSEDFEIWLFGVLNVQMEKEFVKFMQNHLFNKLSNGNEKLKHGIMRKCKETMRRAYADRKRRNCGGSAASVMVVNGEKLVMASMNDHKVVICKNGKAFDLKNESLRSSTTHWSRIIFPVCNLGEAYNESDLENSEIAVVTEKISSDIEFIIIGSYGIWEVMKIQEAIIVIRHIEDPQEAAKCLANEASNRLSKSDISCVVIRFD